MAIGSLAHRPKIVRAIGATLGYWPLVIDLAGISDFQPYISSGGVPLDSFFDMLRLAVVVSLFSLVISCFFDHNQNHPAPVRGHH